MARVCVLLGIVLFGYILPAIAQISESMFANVSYREDNTTKARPLYTVSTVVHTPWVIKTSAGYSGLVVDILNYISTFYGFDYKMREPDDGNYGHLNYDETGQGHFDGIIGDIVNNRADIGAADLLVSDTRSNVVTFSSPFAETGAQILLQKPVTSRNIINFLFLPFTSGAWCLVIFTCAVVCIVWFFVNRYLPHDRSYEKNACNNCNMRLCQLPIQSITHCQGKKASTSVTVTLWCLLICLVSLYTSNLTCALLYHGSLHKTLPFKTFHEMVNQPDIAYGGWFGMKLNLNDELQKRVDKFINSKYTYYNDIGEAVTKIRTSNGKFAAIVDGYFAKSIIRKNCDLVLLADRLFEIYYSFACQKSIQGLELCSSISNSLRVLQQNGTLFTLFEYWWKQLPDTECQGSSEEEYESRHGRFGIRFEPMTAVEVIPVCVVVLVGAFITVVCLVLEIVNRRSIKKNGTAAIEMEEKSPMTSDAVNTGGNSHGKC